MGTVAKDTKTCDVVLLDTDLSWDDASPLKKKKEGCNRQLMSQSKTRTTSLKDQINMNLPTGRLLNHLRHLKSNHVTFICKKQERVSYHIRMSPAISHI